MFRKGQTTGSVSFSYELNATNVGVHEVHSDFQATELQRVSVTRAQHGPRSNWPSDVNGNWNTARQLAWN